MKNPLLAPELREFIRKNDIEGLRSFCAESHPAIIAEFLEALSAAEAWRILFNLQPELRAEIFSHLEEWQQMEIADMLNREELAQLLSDMAPDDRVNLFKNLPENRQETILWAMAKAEREDIRRLSSYAEGTAGAVMTSDYAVLSPNLTAEEAIDKLRHEAPDKETIYYAYVLDEDRHLMGFVSLKDLILAAPQTKITKIMHRDMVFSRASDDQESAARKIQKYDLIAIPVVNEKNVLVGIITHDDALDIITQEQTEDMEKLMAIGGEHEVGVYLHTSAWVHFKNRCGWIIVLAGLGLISGFIVQSFEGLLLQFAVLATFMPMLADTGGNTGSQSSTLVVRALAMQEISPKDVFRVLKKELKVALLLGFILAILAYGRVVLLAGRTNLPVGYSVSSIGIAIAMALALQVITATLIGALLPLAAVKLKFDPAVVASPALTTIVDITGLFIYFATAKIVLGIG